MFSAVAKAKKQSWQLEPLVAKTISWPWQLPKTSFQLIKSKVSTNGFLQFLPTGQYVLCFGYCFSGPLPLRLHFNSPPFGVCFRESLVFRLHSEIDQIHLSIEAQSDTACLPMGDCHTKQKHKEVKTIFYRCRFLLSKRLIVGVVSNWNEHHISGRMHDFGGEHLSGVRTLLYRYDVNKQGERTAYQSIK